MSIISKPNTFSPNTTASSSEMNDNFDTIYDEFNGNIAAANLASDAVTTAKIADSNVTTAKIADNNVTADKLADASVFPANLVAGQSGSSWAWASWTPTLSGRFDDAKWTKTCRYIQIGKTIHYRMKLVANAATPMSGGTTDALFTLPVAHAAGYAGTDQTAGIGSGGIYDNGTAVFPASVFLSSASDSIGRIRTGVSAITSTNPMTWANTDEITVSGTYEAA